jgi:phage recombination protein Bet
MSKSLQQVKNNEIASYNPDLINTLRNSLYPGAKDESITMVVDYCKHAKLDIMLKPVHIVPMWIVDKKNNKGEMRDIVMPGINHYRVAASRSGCAGISEPEFGEDVQECLGGVDITYPKWCKIKVKRIVAGREVEFSAKEYWKENYATAGKDKETGKISTAPNAMWKKRPYGQLAKCTEAQALRKGFPEIGAMPTAEEMEGKSLDVNEYDEIQKQKNISNKGVNGVKAILGLVDEKDDDINIETGEIIENDMTDEKLNLDDLKFQIETALTIKDLLELKEKVKSLEGDDLKIFKSIYIAREKEIGNLSKNDLR